MANGFSLSPKKDKYIAVRSIARADMSCLFVRAATRVKIGGQVLPPLGQSGRMSRQRILALGCLLSPFTAPSFAVEPTLDLRVPDVQEAPRGMAALSMDNRPHWVQRVDAAARYGITFVCLRHGAQGNLVLGAHPNGYVGLFTTTASGGRRRTSC